MSCFSPALNEAIRVPPLVPLVLVVEVLVLGDETVCCCCWFDNELEDVWFFIPLYSTELTNFWFSIARVVSGLSITGVYLFFIFFSKSSWYLTFLFIFYYYLLYDL